MQLLVATAASTLDVCCGSRFIIVHTTEISDLSGPLENAGHVTGHFSSLICDMRGTAATPLRQHWIKKWVGALKMQVYDCNVLWILQ